MLNPVAPVVKIATKTSLFQKLNDVIYINAGAIITGEQTIEEVGGLSLNLSSGLQAVNKGQKTMVSGHDDFIPWRRGISL
jgi:altronate hydrolase